MRRRERLFLFAILFAAAVLRFRGLAFGIPHADTRPDETTIVVTALGFLFAGLNPHYFRWPSLEFYVVSAIYRTGWEIGHLRGLYPLKYDMYQDAAVHIRPFLLVPRVLSVIAGVTTVWLVYTVMARLFDRLTALIAAFFLAVAFLHVRESHFGLIAVPMTALVIAALAALSSAVEDPGRIGRWALAGVFSGLAASTKYEGGLVLAAGVASVFIVLNQSEPTKRAAVLRGMAVLVGAALIAFICGTPYALLDPTNFRAGLALNFNHVMDTGEIMLGRGWWYHLRFSLWYGLGGPLLIAGLAGLVLLAATSWKKAVMMLTFPVLYYAAVGRGYTVLVREIAPVVPFLCMTAALAVVWIVRRFTPHNLAASIVTVVAIAIALPSIQRDVAFDAVIGRTDTRVLAADWIHAHVRPQEWVGQIPPVLVYPDFGMPKPSNLVTFDINRRAFVSASGATVVPDWMVVPTSPLTAYTVGVDEIPAIANRGYAREATISAVHGAEMANWFDQQDPFFVPFTTFTMRDRPGPEIQIFRRRR